MDSNKHSLFGPHPRLSEALGSGEIKFNGIRYIQRGAFKRPERIVQWHLLGFEGDEDSIERKLKEEM